MKPKQSKVGLVKKMPSTSKKQAHFMAAAAHNRAFAKKVGISQSVAKEFNQADKGKKFKGGGMAEKEMHSEKGEMKQDIAQDKKLIKKAFGMHDKQLHENKRTNLTKLKGGGMAKETMGPSGMGKDVEAGSNKLTKFGQSAVQKRGMTKGKNLGDTGPILGIQKMAKGGSASSRADGIASKGKTKGKMC